MSNKETDAVREARWRAESDARTITEAEVIKLDAVRLTAARVQIEQNAKLANAAVAALGRRKPTPGKKK